MTDCIRLYSDPTALACALAINGPIDPFRVGLSYEGRLNVAGQHGEVTIESWDGDLPEGSEVTFDDVRSQIVVTWPTFANVPAQQITIDAENQSLEAGDTGWDLGSGVSIVQNGPPYPPPWVSGSQWSAQYLDESGESELVSQAFVPITSPDTPVHASCAVYQGQSSSGHAGGAVRLKWYDRDKNYLKSSTGDYVTSNTDSVGHSEWHGSDVTALPPPGAYYKRLAGVFFRNRENKALWIDSLGWDGAFTYMADASKVGHENEDPIPFRVAIRDARGCHATWAGEIRDYALYPTSQLYAIAAREALNIPGGSLQRLYARPPVTGDDQAMISGGKLVALTMTRTVSYGTYDHAQDDADSPVISGGSLQALTMTVTVSYGTYNHAQDDADSPVITGGSLQALSMAVTTGYQTYPWTQDDADSPVITGGSLVSLSMTPAT